MCVHAPNVINGLEDRSRGASWLDEEVIALIAVWGDLLLRTKLMHSRRPRSLHLHYEAEKIIKRQDELFLAT